MSVFRGSVVRIADSNVSLPKTCSVDHWEVHNPCETPKFAKGGGAGSL